MELLVALTRALGIVAFIYVAIRTLHRYPPTIYLKHDIVKADTAEPVDEAWMESMRKEQEKQKVV